MNLFHLQPLSLKARFIYAFVFIIIITITILSLSNYFRWKDNYLHQLREEGLILTQTLALGSVHPIVTHNFYSLEEYALKLIKERDIAYVIIMDRHDQVLVKKPEVLRGIPEEVDKGVKDNTDPYLIQPYNNAILNTRINDISVPVIIDSKKWGTVRVGFSLAQIRQEIARNILVVLASGFISVIIGIVMALLLGRLVTGPIEKFGHSMKMVAQGDLTEEINIDSPEEFSVLAKAFNKMARALKQSEEELRDTYQKLKNAYQELRKTHQELKDTCQQLIEKETMAAVGEMTLLVAHRIKNPLGIIKSAVQILLDETKDPEDRNIMGANIIEEVNHLDTRIHSLLHYARPSPVILQKADLNNILEKRIKFWESQRPEERKIIIARRFNPALPLLWLDEQQIGEMALNMIINACEAMPNGGELIISTDLGHQDEIFRSKETNGSEPPDLIYNQGLVRVEFEDTGIGIPEENLGKVFDPFFTTKENGNGLGLSIVKRIVKSHGGKIKVESPKGKGTKFIIFFPLTEKEGNL